MGSKASCLTGFWHHRMTNTSMRTHAYPILCLKVDQKQVCEQSLYVEKIKNNCLNRLTGSKSICTETIIDVLLAESTDN